MKSKAFEERQRRKYKKVKRYSKKNKCTIEEACKECGVNKHSYYGYVREFEGKKKGEKRTKPDYNAICVLITSDVNNGMKKKEACDKHGISTSLYTYYLKKRGEYAPKSFEDKYEEYKRVRKCYRKNNITINKACELCGMNCATYYNYERRFKDYKK